MKSQLWLPTWDAQAPILQEEATKNTFENGNNILEHLKLPTYMVWVASDELSTITVILPFIKNMQLYVLKV